MGQGRRESCLERGEGSRGQGAAELSAAKNGADSPRLCSSPSRALPPSKAVSQTPTHHHTGGSPCLRPAVIGTLSEDRKRHRRSLKSEDVVEGLENQEMRRGWRDVCLETEVEV